MDWRAGSEAAYISTSTLYFCGNYTSTVKMKALSSSEILVFVLSIYTTQHLRSLFQVFTFVSTSNKGKAVSGLN
jgi:hypothetical protein